MIKKVREKNESKSSKNEYKLLAQVDRHQRWRLVRRPGQATQAATAVTVVAHVTVQVHRRRRQQAAKRATVARVDRASRRRCCERPRQTITATLPPSPPPPTTTTRNIDERTLDLEHKVNRAVDRQRAHSPVRRADQDHDRNLDLELARGLDRRQRRAKLNRHELHQCHLHRRRPFHPPLRHPNRPNIPRRLTATRRRLGPIRGRTIRPT